MGQIFYLLLCLLISLPYPTWGSDTSEKVMTASENHIARYQNRSLSYLSDEEPTLPKLTGKDVVKMIESPRSYGLLFSDNENLPLPKMGTVKGRALAETYNDSLKEVKQKLFHAFQAATTCVSSYLEKFQADNTHEFTELIAPLRIQINNQITTNTIQRNIDHFHLTNGNEGILIFTHYSYELNRQRHLLLLTMVLDILTVLKKSLFTLQSDLVEKADLSSEVYSILRDILDKRLPPSMEYKSTHGQGMKNTIFSSLNNIIDALPTSKSHNKKHFLISAAQTYLSFWVPPYHKLVTLLSDTNNQPIKYQLKENYNFFCNNRKFSFPNGKRICFTSPILNLDAIFQNGSVKSEIFLFKRKTAPSTNPEDKTIQNLSAEETEEESIDYSDPSYWTKENAYHQERKRKVQESSDNNAPLPLSDYEKNLFWFLTNYIFSHKFSPKAKELEDLLKAVKFKMEPVKGYGSVRKIYPTPDNPLFGTNENYKDAYFNVHWFADNPVVPYAYYKFIQSGFENVFGLSHEDVEKKMNPIQK